VIFLIAIVVALLPFLIACIRNPGWIASTVIALCTVPVIVLALFGQWQIAAIPWLISLLFACASTSGRERTAKRQHAELMQALAAKAPEQRTPDAVDRFISGGNKP
jgi:hypothetical protein